MRQVTHGGQTGGRGGGTVSRTGQRGVAVERGRDLLLQGQSGSSVHAGSSQAAVADALEDLEGLWVEETVVEHQGDHPWGGTHSHRPPLYGF